MVFYYKKKSFKVNTFASILQYIHACTPFLCLFYLFSPLVILACWESGACSSICSVYVFTSWIFNGIYVWSFTGFYVVKLHQSVFSNIYFSYLFIVNISFFQSNLYAVQITGLTSGLFIKDEIRCGLQSKNTPGICTEICSYLMWLDVSVRRSPPR